MYEGYPTSCFFHAWIWNIALNKYIIYISEKNEYIALRVDNNLFTSGRIFGIK